MREKRTPSSRWTPEHWMQVSTPRLVLSHVGSAKDSRSCLGCGPLPSSSASLLCPAAQSRTCSPTVAALAVPGSALHLGDEQLGDILRLPVQPGAPPGHGAAAGLPEEGAAQGFVLAVLQH